MDESTARLLELRARLVAAAQRRGHGDVVLLAVSKMRTSQEIRAMHAAGQAAFGENYVQEAMGKQSDLGDIATGIEWHLIGHLQSNKAKEAANHFDWVQSVDRRKLVEALADARPSHLPPLNVLVQVNIDDEAGKHGCRPDEVEALCDAIVTRPNLALRGLMAIPAPSDDPAIRRAAFAAMRALFDQMEARFPSMDTLSMGMSDDAELAIAEGSTMVRIGTALFGPRPAKRSGLS